MIGDWVLWRGTPLKIMSINDKTSRSLEPTVTGLITIDGKETIRRFNAKSLKPIPITPEILAKNGFNDTINNIELDRDNILKWYDVYGYCVIIILKANQIIIQHDSHILLHLWYNNLVSVHELQHALRICGITEKRIKL